LKPTVIDASAAGAWVLPDAQADAAEALFAQARLPDAGFHAPALFPWEMGNMLSMARRRRRIGPDAVELALQTLSTTRIQLDASPDLPRQLQVARLAQTHDLTYYDAAYLELVLRLNGQLASRDRELLNAARACGIVCLTF
jgi:predicted nucleic acid-binding protein